MFSVEKLSQFESANPSYRILKPWWDVLTDYLSAVMLIIALSAGAMQVLQGHVICLPAAECNFNLTNVSHDSRNGSIPVSTSFLRTNRSFCQKYYASAKNDPRKTIIALTKLEDRRQYDFVDAQCGQEAVHWFASYLPFILFLQVVILVIIDNFWLKFPKTSSTMDHFVKLVLECFNSPGTCLDVSNVLWGTRISDSAESNATEDIELGERDTLLPDKTEEDALSGQTQSTQSDGDSTSDLDLSEAIKAKTLCEKIRHFQKDLKHQNCQFLRWIYLAQALVQGLLSMAFFSFNIVHCSSINSTVKCDIDGAIYGHYKNFKCSYAIAVYFRLTLTIFCVFIAPYCVLCVIISFWTCSEFKEPFTFQEVIRFDTEALKLGDIEPVNGDLAFMLHLLNNYNKLYLYRFALFLSEKNEKNLKDFILSKKWPLHKLEMMSTEERTKLRLNSLTGIPKTIFQLSQLESLTLEDCSLTKKDFDLEDWQKLELRSLSLVRCRLKSIPNAIFQNREFLETLDVSYNEIRNVPENIADLNYLQTLNIAGNNVTEGVDHIAKINSLRKLYVNETVVSIMSEETKEALKGVIDTGRRSPDDVTVKEYSPSKAPYIETRRKDKEQVYKMTSKPKGSALIFKFVSYEHAVTRNGSNVDAERLEKLFTGIGYSVIVRQDPSSAMVFKNDLRNLANVGNGDSVIVAVLANGAKERVFCCNGDIVSVDEIVSIVGMVDIYKNKPKLIFIQAYCAPWMSFTSMTCLQTTSQNSTQSDEEAYSAPIPDAARDSDSDSDPVNKPSYPDMLISYSTFPGFVSYRNPRKGSWYIQCLVEVFSQHAFEKDVLSLLRYVNFKVPRKFKTKHSLRKIPAPKSSLTKRLFFLPGYFDDDNHSSAASTPT